MFTLSRLIILSALIASAPYKLALAEFGDPAVYGALPNVTEVRISPDGSTAAALQNVGGKSAVIFYNIDNPNEPPVGARIGDVDARSIDWVSNEHLLLLVSDSRPITTSSGLGKMEFFRWASVSKSTLTAKYLFMRDRGYYLSGAGELMSVLPDQPDKALFARLNTRGRVNYALLAADLNTGRATAIENGSEYTSHWIVDETGKAVARIDYNVDRKRREIHVHQDGASKMKLFKTFPEGKSDPPKFTFYGLNSDKSALFGSTYLGGGRRSLIEFSLETGELSGLVFNDPKYDILDLNYDPWSATIVSVEYIDDLPRTYHINSNDRKLQKSLRAALPGAAPMIVSKSADGMRMIVEAIYTDHPKQFFLFDRAKRSLNMIAPSYTALDGKVAANKEKFDYVASDGLKIPGYLTVPVKKAAGPTPLIVLPHGGPESRSDQSFDYWSFFYASRGYLVYEPNFRGSYGYGLGYRKAGYGEWGRKMQSDITEGVQKLIADGIADPDRICIVGASYGGYAALAGATLTPDLYACAISVNGVSNLPGMLGEEARYSEYAEDYWEKRIGSRFRDVKALNAVSPAKIADQTGPPVMLIVSKDDVVVPPSQSRQMRSALKAAGKPHEYVELDGEDHWLSTGAMRTEMLRRTISFIDQHIGQKN